MATAVRSEGDPRSLRMNGNGVYAYAVMGGDASKTAVDPSLRVHGVNGLYAMDASVLPTTLGVNPQGTIMAVVRVAAERLAAA